MRISKVTASIDPQKATLKILGAVENKSGSVAKNYCAFQIGRTYNQIMKKLKANQLTKRFIQLKTAAN